MSDVTWAVVAYLAPPALVHVVVAVAVAVDNAVGALRRLLPDSRETTRWTDVHGTTASQPPVIDVAVGVGRVGGASTRPTTAEHCLVLADLRYH